MHQTKTRKKI
jgi:hypothetical protein